MPGRSLYAVALSLVVSAWGCGGEAPRADAGVLPDAAVGDGGHVPDGGDDAGRLPDGGPLPDAGGVSDAGARPNDGGTQVPDAGVCHESYATPPSNLAGWSPALSRSGADTLTHQASHSHNDGSGPLGFCPAAVAQGGLYLKLVSARFETDQSPPTAACVVDYQKPDPVWNQYGMCFSGGNRHIYVEVRDEQGKRLRAGFDVFYGGGQVIPVSDQGKPSSEFPMNFPINGGGARYGARARYAHPSEGNLPSDAVTNMRLPINHHVNYLLTFQVSRR